jgi:hypothetical protein
VVQRKQSINQSVLDLRKGKQHTQQKTTIAMKTKRIINGAFWGAIGLAACIGTCIVWHKNGCQIESLIAAIAYYTGAPFAIGYTIDSCICGR